VFLEDPGIPREQLRKKAQAQGGITNANFFRVLGKWLVDEDLKENENTKGRPASKPPAAKLRSVSLHNQHRFPFRVEWNRI
jgi:hypothetical protein